MRLKACPIKKRCHLLFVAGAAFSLCICSSDSDEDERSDTGPDFAISELQGTWYATNLTFSYSEAGERPDPDFVNIIDEGRTAIMRVQSSGSFSLTIAPVDREAFVVKGQMFSDDSEFFAIEFDGEDDYEYFGAILNGYTFTINEGANTAEYDLDLNGTNDPCSAYLVLQRD